MFLPVFASLGGLDGVCFSRQGIALFFIVDNTYD